MHVLFTSIYILYYIFKSYLFIYLLLTSIHSDSHDSNKLTPTTLTYSLPLQLWHAHFHHWSARLHNSDIFTFQPLICFVSLLWHAHSHLSDMLTLTSLTIWLRWEQGGSGGSGFAGSKLVAVDPALQVGVKLASLVAVDLASLGASW